MSREQTLQRLVAEGVEAPLACEILDSIERNRPRPRPLRMAFGLVFMGLGAVAFLFTEAKLATVLIVGGAFWVWDGARGKR